MVYVAWHVAKNVVQIQEKDFKILTRNVKKSSFFSTLTVEMPKKFIKLCSIDLHYEYFELQYDYNEPVR